MKVVPFLSSCCGDPKLHTFLNILDGRKLHRDRRLGGACLFRVNPTALLEFVTIATSFDGVRFRNLLVMSHTDCVAIKENSYFAVLREKRESYSADLTGDIAFHTRVLSKVKKQTDGLPFDIQWHFGIVQTHLAEQLSPEDSLDHVLDQVMVWPFGAPPRDIFEKDIEKLVLNNDGEQRIAIWQAY